MNVVLIGVGAWGKNYIKTIENNFSDVNLTLANRYDWKNLIDDKPDGVIVATPPDSHIEIASYSLERNIPTMIEKPLALSLEQALLLKKFEHIPILVNYIQLFATGYEKLKLFTNYQKINKIITNGYNNSPTRSYSSLWDYGPHDIAMILDLIQTMPSKIEANVLSKNIYQIIMYFDDLITTSIVGSGALEKKRDITINNGYMDICYNDIKRPEYHKAPLHNALSVFIEAISYYKNNGNINNFDNRLGLDLSFKVIHVLEECEKLLLNK